MLSNCAVSFENTETAPEPLSVPGALTTETLDDVTSLPAASSASSTGRNAGWSFSRASPARPETHSARVRAPTLERCRFVSGR